MYNEDQNKTAQEHTMEPCEMDSLKTAFFADDINFDLKQYSGRFPSLALTKCGNIFDGVIRKTWVGKYCSGLIFFSDKFPDNSLIQTSEIVLIGVAPPFGRYIETVTGSRYLVTSALDAQGRSDWFHQKARNIAENAGYYRPKQWS